MQPKLQSCRLRVAPQIGPTVYFRRDFGQKRNPQLSWVYVFCFVSVYYLYIVYILLYMYIYLYIIYNIIKNKKKNPPIGLHTYTEEKTDTQRKLRVAFLVKIGSTVCCGWDLERNSQLATLVIG